MKLTASPDWRYRLIRVSIGIIYIWFGALKFFPEVSPAEVLAKDTIDMLTLGLIPTQTSYLILALWETVLGFMLVIGLCPKCTITLALLHMLGTFMPLVLLSEVTFGSAPVSLTLVGQYIMKNLIIVAALLAIFPIQKPWFSQTKLG
jgi:uncharacterized membrane protein YphA (DoxX/SURF4 family)